MRYTSFADMDCSIARCLDIIGERWSLLIVREAFLGTTRFDRFQERLGIARTVLNQRMARLVEEGILVREAYQEHPPRYDYLLTTKGRDLWPVITTMRQWGNVYSPPPDGPSVRVVHEACGHLTSAVLTCAVCGEPMESSDVRLLRRNDDAPSSDSTPSNVSEGARR